MISTSLERLKGRLREAGRPMLEEATTDVAVVVVMDGLPGLLLLVVPTVLVRVVPVGNAAVSGANSVGTCWRR